MKFGFSEYYFYLLLLHPKVCFVRIQHASHRRSYTYPDSNLDVRQMLKQSTSIALILIDKKII